MNISSLIEVLSNRELAVITWIVFLLLFFTVNGKKDGAGKQLLKLLSAKVFIIIFFSVLAYSLFTLSILLLLNNKLYSLSTLKIFTIWFLFTALPSVGNFIKVKDSAFYINSSIKKIISLTIIVDLIHEISVFSYITELFLIPVIFILGFTLAYSNTESKKIGNGTVKKVANFCLTLVAIILLGNFFMKVTHVESFQAISPTIYSLLIAIYLSILFIPIIILLSKYSRLEKTYLTINHQLLDDEKLTFFEFFYIIYRLNFNLKNLERWQNSIAMKCNRPSKGDLYIKINELSEVLKREFLDVEIPFERGWSSEKARNFLKKNVPKMGFYKEVGDGSWFAASDYVIIHSDNYIENNIAYYVEGNSQLVEQLKVVGNMNSIVEEDDFLSLFTEFTTNLFEEAFDVSTPLSLKTKFIKLDPFQIKFNSKNVTLTKDNWITNKGYHLTFSIENLPLDLRN